LIKAASVAHALEPSAALPLVVDLDGTLLRTDTAFELIAANLAKNPLAVAGALATGVVSRARMKERLAQTDALDIDALPLRDDLVAYLAEQRKAGRELHLVSAADQAIVDKVARRIGLFDSATGSRDGVNLKGPKKAAYLADRFPQGFVYAGDSPADGPVWRASAGAVLAGSLGAAARAQQRSGAPLEAAFPAPALSFKDWRKALRLHQWAKNILIFVAPVMGHEYDNLQALLACFLGFLLLGVVASGTYLLNDLIDLQSDRRHPTKRLRMLASGRLQISRGLVLAPLLILGGVALSFLLSPMFGSAIAAYLVITLAYSLRLKRVPFLDTLLLAWLFTLRILMGAALVTGVVVSEWLLVFSMFFFFGLSIAKRHVEVLKRGRAGGGELPGRGFSSQDEAVTLAFGVSSSVASILILVLYLMEAAFPTGFYTAPVFLWAMPVLVGGWLTRVWLLAHRGQLDDDPVAFAIRDKVSVALGAALAVSFGAAAFIDGGPWAG
jgi:4-hydroxybenzoate polyprenyltransferase